MADTDPDIQKYPPANQPGLLDGLTDIGCDHLHYFAAKADSGETIRQAISTGVLDNGLYCWIDLSDAQELVEALTAAIASAKAIGGDAIN